MAVALQRRVMLPSLALVRRELLTELRRPRAFAVILLAAALSLAVVAMRWPENVHDLNMASAIANGFFEGLAWSIMWFVAIVLPAMSANAIVQEHERETFELVRMSLVTSSGFVMAKFVNSMGLFLTILIGLTPIFGAIFFLAGIDMVRVATVLLLLTGLGMAATSVSLLSSAFSRRTIVAVIASYASLAFIAVAPILAMFLAQSTAYALGFTVRSFREGIEFASTRLSLVGSFDQAVDGSLRGVEALLPLATQFILTAVCLALTIWRVHRPIAPPKIETRKSIGDAKVLAQRRRKFPYYLIDPLKKRPPIEDRRNPMLVREIRWGLMTRGSVLARIFYVSLTVYFFVAAAGVFSSQGGADVRGWIVTQIVLTLCVAPGLLANALTKERELGNLDMLRMTLISPREIVMGKLFSGVMTLLPVLAAAVISVIPLVYWGRAPLNIVLMGYGTLFISVALALALSLLASLIAKRTTAAIAWAYGLVLAVFAGAPLAARVGFYWYVRDLRSPGRLSDTGASNVGMSSPIEAYLHSAQWSYSTRFHDIDYWFWGAHALCTLALSAAIVAFVAWYFERYRMSD